MIYQPTTAKITMTPTAPTSSVIAATNPFILGVIPPTNVPRWATTPLLCNAKKGPVIVIADPPEIFDLTDSLEEY